MIRIFVFSCLLFAIAVTAHAQPTELQKALWTAYGIRPMRPANEPSALLTEHHDLVYGKNGDRELKFDLYIHPAAKNPPLVVLVHGGGWHKGDKESFAPLARKIAVRGYTVAAIEYRLADEAKFPAAIHDCNGAVSYLRAHAEEFGFDPSRIAAVGGSAGGHLVGLMSAGTHHPELQAEPAPLKVSNRLQAAVVMAGPMWLGKGSTAAELSAKDPMANCNRWLGKTFRDAPALYELASPHVHFTKDSPPILFMTGEWDRPERNETTRAKLRDLKVDTRLQVYALGRHGCWNQEPWQSQMAADIVAFFDEVFDYHSQPIIADVGEGSAPVKLTKTAIETFAAKGVTKITIPPFHNPILKTIFKPGGAPKPITLTPNLHDWSIALPPDHEDETVFVHTIGRPRPATIPVVSLPLRSGKIELPAHHATTFGEFLRYEPQPHKNCVGYWVNPKDWCEWRFYVSAPGAYEFILSQGCGKGQGGSDVAAVVTGPHGEVQNIHFTVEDTGHFQKFRIRKLNEFLFPEPGVYRLELRVEEKSPEGPTWILSLIVSRLHLNWIATICGRLRSDYSYSNTLGWNTFPVPPLSERNKTDLTHCAEDILLARESHFPATIADLYDPEKMPENLREAHDRNDETLERIYIGRRFKNDTERLEKLFEMYIEMTQQQD